MVAAWVSLVFFVHPAVAEWVIDADAAIVHDDNLTNAAYDFDVVGDWAVALSASVGKRFQFSGYDSLTVSAQASGEKYFEVTGLDNAALGLEARFRHKLGLGLAAPWVGLGVSTSHMSFDRDIRDGWRHRVTLGGGKRIGRRLDLSAELAFERRTADHIRPEFPGVSGAVFNLSSESLRLNAVYLFGGQVYASVGYELRRGDVVSTLLVYQPGQSIYAVTTAVEEDPAFGDEAYAYRLKGTSHTVDARLSAAITGSLTANMEYARVMTLARGGNNYTKNVVRLTLSCGF
jgi:hypothetical protein